MFRKFERMVMVARNLHHNLTEEGCRQVGGWERVQLDRHGPKVIGRGFTWTAVTSIVPSLYRWNT
jgi:hypothetical protein